MKTLLITAIATLSFSAAFADEVVNQNQELILGDGPAIVCRAHDGRGYVFQGVADQLQVARERAIQQCEDFGSQICILDGCHYAY